MQRLTSDVPKMPRDGTEKRVGALVMGAGICSEGGGELVLVCRRIRAVAIVGWGGVTGREGGREGEGGESMARDGFAL